MTMRGGKRGVLQQLVAITVALASCWVCGQVARYLWNTGPGLAWKLRQTVRSLPPPPEGVTLVLREQRSEGGSDCDALALEEIYGTERSLEDIVRYYQQELVADGWTDLYGFDPERIQPAEFSRGRDEYLWLISGNELRSSRRITRIRVLDQMNQFSTVYGLHVGRHCLLDWR